MSEVILKEEKEATVVQQDNSLNGLISIVQQVAANPDIDIDKIDRLFDLQLKMLDRQSEKDFNISLSAAQGEMQTIATDKQNKQTASEYATLAAISKSIKPVCSSHGFSLSFGSDDCLVENHYRITAILSHSGGYSRDYKVDIPIDIAGIKGSVNKTGTHAFGSTMTYGRRYLTTLIFDLVFGNDDDGVMAGAGKLVASDQMAEIYSLLYEAKASKDKILTWLNIESIETMPISAYVTAKEELMRRIKMANKNG